MARRTEPTVRIRVLKSEHERWSWLKHRRGLSTNNDVALYLSDLADVADVNVAPGSGALSSSIVPGVALLLARYYRTVYTRVRTACTILLFVIIIIIIIVGIHTRIKVQITT